MGLQKQVIQMLAEILSLPEEQVIIMDGETQLLGEIPEFDSMAVVSVITTMEEQFSIIIDDDDISGETFESVGSLTNYLDRRLTENS